MWRIRIKAKPRFSEGSTHDSYKTFSDKNNTRSVVAVSENLEQIVENDTSSDTDIVLVTSIVEKIANSLTVAQRNENQVRFCLDFFCKFQIIYIYLNKLRMDIFFCSDT